MNPTQPDTHVMLSALQHASYCLRQCALIHLEQTFDENLYTLRGHRSHQKVHTACSEQIGDVYIERNLPLYSDSLGIYGYADAVELKYNTKKQATHIYPVEYKQGKRHQAEHDDIQLCAQALCLEEMFGLSIHKGAIFHVRSKKRRVVAFTPALRTLTLQTIDTVRQLWIQIQEKPLHSLVLPSPVADQRRCTRCSLQHSCLPTAIQSNTK